MTSDVRKRLFELQDLQYKEFQCKLLPGVDPKAVIGVRIPQLRQLAKTLLHEGKGMSVLENLPHPYYDENNLHAFILSELKDYDEVIARLNSFLPFVDNWATCDLMSPKVFRLQRNHPRLITDVRHWMGDSHPFTIRFGVETLMRYFLDDSFKTEYLVWVSELDHPHYYVRMMVAWFFATALAKQYEAALPFMEKNCLPQWIHNKTIQKAVESYRVSDVHKQHLRMLRRR